MEGSSETVVPDRWHLIRNLTDAVERAAARHHLAWTAALREHAEREREEANDDVPNGVEESGPAWIAAPARDVAPREVERKRAAQQRRQDRYDRVTELTGKGISKMKIARWLNLDGGTVAAYLQLGGPSQGERCRRTPTLLDTFLPYLETRFLDAVAAMRLS